MAVGWLGRWRLRIAIRRRARKFGATLLRDYGASESYTPGQIEHAVRKLGLPRRFLCVVQAGFLPEQDFNQLNPRCRFGSYAELRNLLRRYMVWVPTSAAFEPIGVSEYVSAGESVR